MKIENNKAVVSQKEGTIVIVSQGFICISHSESLNHYKTYFYEGEVIKAVGKFEGVMAPEVIAANFKLEGVPILVKRDAEWLADEWVKNKFPLRNVNNDGLLSTGYVYGYNARAETHPFTEDDLITAMNLCFGLAFKDPKDKEHHRKTVIEQLRQPQVPERLELDVVEKIGDAGIIAHAFGECEFELKSDNGIIYY